MRLCPLTFSITPDVQCSSVPGCTIADEADQQASGADGNSSASPSNALMLRVDVPWQCLIGGKTRFGVNFKG